jgi:adenylate cyclase
MSGSFPKNLVRLVMRIGANSSDSDDIRLQKTLLVLSSLMMASLAIIWGLIYVAFREFQAGAIPLFYSILSFLSIISFSRIRRYRFFRTSQLLLSLLLPFFLMIALGGFVNSSGVVLWSLSCPLGALVFAERRQAVGWFMAYIALVIIGAILEPFMQTTTNLPLIMRVVFFVMNIGGTSTVVFVLLQYFVRQKDTTLKLLHVERAKSENLLLNILPKDIANILKNESRTIADQHDQVSVLFADIVNFTPMSALMTPVELVELLNDVFSYFDMLVEKYGLEKIKTIGDCYMAAAGIPQARPDHALVLTRMALEVRDHLTRQQFRGQRIAVRIGINSGPVVAGVIGHMKFAYDLWGDVVNTASRMESHGVRGEIQVTRATFELIKNDFVCESRGMISVKGKGEMEVWQVKDATARALA